MFVKEITATVSSPTHTHTHTHDQTASLTHIRIQIKRNAVNNVVKKKSGVGEGGISKGSQRRLKLAFCSDRD